MKKKSLIVLMTVTLAITTFGLVGPASAKQPFDVRAVFEADIVPTGTHSLEKGEVYIRENGSFKVEIEGAEIETTYRVELLFGFTDSPTPIYLGDIETDEEGEGKLEGALCLVDVEFVGNPWIEIYSGYATPVGALQFVSGFIPVPCPE